MACVANNVKILKLY